ncbi:MAG: thiamine pyrophosphate-dependent enzyme, partial [Thermoanaerobaculia bacterium]|nr:thiamine pyrophosphate-dependent enzyme [Thermoanaerobaculia bacterium]
SYVLRPRGPLSWLDPGPFGTLGVGAGFALASSLARPDSEVWLIWGDGSAGFGLLEIDTFVRHGIPVIAVIGNDACWTQIAREQVEILDDDVGCVLRSSDYHLVAEALGGEGLDLANPKDIGSTIDRARKIASAGKPVVINARIGETEFRKGSISM